MTIIIQCVLLILVLNLSTHPKTRTIDCAVRHVGFGAGNSAWVLTRKGEIVRTTDGGVKWSRPSRGDAARRHVTFVGNRGWAVDDEGHVGITYDGGQIWQPLSRFAAERDPDDIGPIITIEFTDELHGWVIDPSSLWRTTDGGETWQERDVAEQFCFLHFVSRSVGWIGGPTGTIYKTVDGGETWLRKVIDQKGAPVRGISFAGDRVGWLSTHEGIFNTSDGGDSWAKMAIPGTDVVVTSIQFLNEKEGWATVVDFKPEAPGRWGFKSMLIHTVDGENWQIATTINGEEWYQEVHFSDERHGWLYTGTGLYRTADRGRSWNLVLQYPRANYNID